MTYLTTFLSVMFVFVIATPVIDCWLTKQLDKEMVANKHDLLD